MGQYIKAGVRQVKLMSGKSKVPLRERVGRQIILEGGTRIFFSWKRFFSSSEQNQDVPECLYKC